MRFLTLLLSAVVCGCTASPLKVHMLSGSEEYTSEASLKKWAGHLETKFGIKPTFSLGTDRVTTVGGLDHLTDADVLVVFCRRWELSGEQAERVVEYIESGRPILAIRTASHAFQFYQEFDKEILGGDYSGHDEGNIPVKIDLVRKSAGHPVLKGVSGWERLGKPYRNPVIADDVLVLLSSEVNNSVYPMAWLRSTGKQRVFYTSLGIPSDFDNPSFVRLLDNALMWVAEGE